MKFKFRDRVCITGGFYEGLMGFVDSYRENTGLQSYKECDYLVEIDDGSSPWFVVIESVYLKKIEEVQND